MYTSPEEARSDLLLAAAVFLFGPLALGILLRYIPLPGAAAVVVGVLVDIATTVAVPYLLIRYRHESLADYGLRRWSRRSATAALVAVCPAVLASLLVAVVDGGSLVLALPAAQVGTGDGALLVGLRLLRMLCRTLLAVYVTVKARDAWRGDPTTVRSGFVEVGRIVAVAAGLSAVLLAIGLGVRGLGLEEQARFVLYPLGLATGAVLVERLLRGPSTTTRATLATPTVLLALGVFGFSGESVQLLVSVWGASLAAATGLLVAVLVEHHRTAAGALVLTLVLAAATTV